MKTAAITGTSRGIGLSCALRFQAAGWRVIGCGRGAGPPGLAREPHRHIRADLATGAGIDAFVAEAGRAIGGGALHVLVNNAGISPKTSFKERLGTLNGSLEHWREVFELNLFAPLALARGLATALHRGQGAVVNVTSIAGHRVHPFAGSAYACSKAALSALTREMAAEFAHLGVRVNAVAPGEIETAMTAPEYDHLLPRIPLRRMGSSDEVADAVLWLAGQGAGYVSGAELMVTGGQHLL